MHRAIGWNPGCESHQNRSAAIEEPQSADARPAERLATTMPPAAAMMPMQVVEGGERVLDTSLSSRVLTTGHAAEVQSWWAAWRSRMSHRRSSLLRRRWLGKPWASSSQPAFPPGRCYTTAVAQIESRVVEITNEQSRFHHNLPTLRGWDSRARKSATLRSATYLHANARALIAGRVGRISPVSGWPLFNSVARFELASGPFLIGTPSVRAN
jgi:hypothetical protein